MATSVYYSSVGKSLLDNWSTFFTFYWKDFNPNVPTWTATSQNEMTTSWETSYNLSWFQVGNEVCCCLFWFDNAGASNVYVSWDMDFQHKIWSQWYSAWWSESNWADVMNNGWYMHYYYAWIDDDEIRPWYSDYRFHIEWSSTDGSTGTINIPFSISNLSFDDSLHTSGYLWIEWTHLCYTDATHNSQWYKHKINYDSNYSWWSWSPGYIRVWDSSSADKYIYYTDANWTVRRTYYSNAWYGWSYSPSWAKKWNIRVSDWDYTEWYWYLCFVDRTWELRRICNWTPT